MCVELSRALGIPTPIRLRKLRAAAAVDALAVAGHPCADLVKQLAALRGETPGRVRPDVQNHVSALADAFDQLADQHGCGLVIRVIGHIAPVVVHGCAQLPRDALTADVTDALRRQKLLGTDEIPAVICRAFRDKTSKALAAGLEPIIHDDLRLVTAYHLHQLRGPPRLAAQRTVGKIEPENVDFSVLCDQFLNLPVHIGKVAVKIDLFVLIGGVPAHRVVGVIVFREIRMVPVEQGVVKPHAQPLGADCFHKFPYQIAPTGSVRALVIRQCGVKQAEPVVMLRRQHDILHPGPLCPPRPVSGIIGFCGKLPHIALILRRRHPCPAHVPFAAPGDRVESPVQEHPEPGLLKPPHPFFSFRHCRCSFPARLF